MVQTIDLIVSQSLATSTSDESAGGSAYELVEGFEKRNFTVNGVEIAARISTRPVGTRFGTQPALLLHGFPQTHVMWHRVAQALREDFDLVLPDLRGYGARPGGCDGRVGCTTVWRVRPPPGRSGGAPAGAGPPAAQEPFKAGTPPTAMGTRLPFRDQ